MNNARRMIMKKVFVGMNTHMGDFFTHRLFASKILAKNVSISILRKGVRCNGVTRRGWETTL